MLIIDNAYKNQPIKKVIDVAATPESIAHIKLDLVQSYNWYDFSVKIEGFDVFEKRYAGRVETGNDSYSDPLMGGMI
ncbi:Non-hemolytic phospholipase C precursor [compost metagenome]